MHLRVRNLKYLFWLLTTHRSEDFEVTKVTVHARTRLFTIYKQPAAEAVIGKSEVKCSAYQTSTSQAIHIVNALKVEIPVKRMEKSKWSSDIERLRIGIGCAWLTGSDFLPEPGVHQGRFTAHLSDT